MKILITENQLKSLIKNIIKEQNDIGQDSKELKLLKKKTPMEIWFINNILDHLIEKPSSKYPNYTYYVDKKTGQVYMEYNKKTKDLWVNYDTIWSYFYKNYSYNYEEIRELIKDLVGEHLNLWDVTPPKEIIFTPNGWENI